MTTFVTLQLTTDQETTISVSVVHYSNTAGMSEGLKNQGRGRVEM